MAEAAVTNNYMDPKASSQKRRLDRSSLVGSPEANGSNAVEDDAKLAKATSAGDVALSANGVKEMEEENGKEPEGVETGVEVKAGDSLAPLNGLEKDSDQKPAVDAEGAKENGTETVNEAGRGAAEGETNPSVSATDCTEDEISAELEKKRKRAERFGLPVVTTEVEKRKVRSDRFGLNEVDMKKKERALRFGLSSSSTLSERVGAAAKAGAEVDAEESTKRKARAERFGASLLSASIAGADEKQPGKGGGKNDEEVKRGRAERSGLSSEAKAPVNPEEAEKRKERAEKFGIPLKSDQELEQKKKERAARFGTALN